VFVPVEKNGLTALVIRSSCLLK